MEFIQVDITAHADFLEMLIAELSENNFDSFWEKDENSFIAYIEKTAFNEQIFADLKKKYPDSQLSYQFEGMESKNWNEEWEKNFQPIVIADKCYVRATFHEPKPEYPLELIIVPKMSFGTGHHATTSMMIENLLALDLKDKKVMDVGTGSGILAIAASKLGANEVYAFDFDEWSVENSVENLELNNVTNVKIEKGTINELLPLPGYDIILANITRNILLEEIGSYVSCLLSGGYLVISGFYKEDISAFDPITNQYNLLTEKTLIRDNWASVIFRKG
jgi:ribosomal protein L11 methyltransferase